MLVMTLGSTRTAPPCGAVLFQHSLERLNRNHQDVAADQLKFEALQQE